MKADWRMGMKIYTNELGHMTNMAAHIWKKTLKIFFSRTNGLMTLKHGMWYQVLKYYQDCSFDDLGLTLTYFTARSNIGKC